MADAGDKSQQHWALVGKVLAGLASVATLILLLFFLYDRYASGADLIARVSTHDFRMPPRIEHEAKVAELEPWYERYSDDYYKYLVVTIENTGGTQAENVTFTSQYSGVARIETDTSGPRDTYFSSSIDIGEIAPSQTLTLQLWTGPTLTMGGAKDIVIRHRTGIADIIFLRETDGWWRELGRGLLMAVPVVILILVTLIFAGALRITITHKGRKWIVGRSAAETDGSEADGPP